MCGRASSLSYKCQKNRVFVFKDIVGKGVFFVYTYIRAAKQKSILS